MDSKESKRPETVVKATGGGGVVVVKPTPSRRPNLNPNKAALKAREVALAAPNGGSNSEVLDLGGGYSGSRASFAERLATRSDGTGRPPTGKPSNTARFKTMTLSHLCSPCIAIPPGVSPSTLLDSPVLLSSQKAEPSPTTGTFPLPPILLESSPATPVSDSTEGKPPPPPDQDGSPEFEFKPFPKPSKRNSSPPALGSLGMFGISHQQDLAQTQTLVLTSPSSVNPPKLVAPLQFIKPPPEPRLQPPLPETVEKPVPAQRSISTSPSASPIADKTQLALPTLLTERPSDDGFNWRKYGQKQVKGCEFPRSYYKCTHIGCPVKRKVERSPDGQVTEIIYKGDHNHAKPQATRRMSVGASHLLDAVGGGVSRESSRPAIAGKANDNSVNTKNEDDSLFTTKKRLVPYSGGPTGSPEHSVTSTSEDEAEDREDSKVEVVVDREPNSKRRKNDKSEEMVVVTAPLRTIREPRVVLQTTSDVDILDDGYRWRKYGQKVVKGNPHQRSYYKCKNMGCPVRKHVERSATDPKAVITTYEGKHNHDAPVGRNSHLATTSSTGGNPIQLSPNNVTKPSSSLHDQYFYRN